MKRFLAVMVAALMMVSLVGNVAFAENRLEQVMAEGKIRMATSPDFAPYEFIDLTKTGQDSIVGHEITLAKYIADKLGVELVIEAMDFSATQAAVAQGNVDMSIAGFAATPERAESMELSHFYNYNTEDKGQGLLVLKDRLDEFQKAEDFAGKTVAVQNASLQYNLLTKQLPEAVPELITSLNDAVMMLITGKVDAVAVAGSNGEAFADNYPDIAMCGFYFDYTSEGNVLLVQKGQTELIEKINEIIDEVNELGLYKQWSDDAKELARSLGIDFKE